jgi:hypothetical protein
MNERIKELAKQAGIEFTYDPTEVPMKAFVEAWEDELEKFAESLIRKCAQVSEDDITDGDACCTNTAYRISRQIKKHFGVEQ